MTDQAVKELEKMGIKQPRHKAWDRCDCEDCTEYKLKLEIFQKGKDESIRETLDKAKELKHFHSKYCGRKDGVLYDKIKYCVDYDKLLKALDNEEARK